MKTKIRENLNYRITRRYAWLPKTIYEHGVNYRLWIETYHTVDIKRPNKKWQTIHNTGSRTYAEYMIKDNKYINKKEWFIPDNNTIFVTFLLLLIPIAVRILAYYLTK